MEISVYNHSVERLKKKEQEGQISNNWYKDNQRRNKAIKIEKGKKYLKKRFGAGFLGGELD